MSRVDAGRLGISHRMRRAPGFQGHAARRGPRARRLRERRPGGTAGGEAVAPLSSPAEGPSRLEHIPIRLNWDVLSLLAWSHVLFGKPVSTLPGHALACRGRTEGTHWFNSSCRKPIDAVVRPPYGPPPLSAFPNSGNVHSGKTTSKRQREVWPCLPSLQPASFRLASLQIASLCLA